MKLGRIVLSAAVAAGFAAGAQAQYSWSPNKPGTGQAAPSVPELRLNPMVRTWGAAPQGQEDDDTDIRLTNQEFYLTCTFSGKLDAGSELTQRELDRYSRRLEKNGFFERLQEFMVEHEQEFAWAQLYCVNRYAAAEIAEREEREARAIERAERARERRRSND